MSLDAAARFNDDARMRDGRASATATWAAVFRAAGARGLGGVPPNEDTLVEAMLPLRWRAVLAWWPTRQIARGISERLHPGVIAWHNARTRTLDLWVREELARLPRPARLVVVAAGLDTRARRLVHANDRVEVVELDHPSTQAMKRTALARLQSPPGVTPRLVPIDLARDDLSAHLGVGIHTCVVLEGVTMYLAADRVDAILRACSALPAGSSLLFDVLRADVLADPDAFAGARAQMRAVAARGEPYVTAFAPAALHARLAAHGLSLVDDLGADALTPAANATCDLFRLVRARRVP